MSGRPLRVLCLDIEGGYGGSSRSLYESIRHLDRDAAAVEVWCRRAGPIQDRYAALGIPVRVAPAMPKVSSLPRLSRNLVVYGNFLREWSRSRPFRDVLQTTTNKRFDLVHFNHEALFMLARWLRPRVAVPATMHIRTMLRDTAFARRQVRTISRTLDHLVFITENERDNFVRLGGSAPGTVVHNIAGMSDRLPSPHPDIPADARLRIACISNYSWGRGLDRLVEIAEALARLGRRDGILFVVAGNMRLSRSLPGPLGAIGRRGGTLADYAAAKGVDDMLLFLGHVAEPERVLAGCHALVKPTRENNPWGRDIVEAMAYGRPVISVGRWTNFVETGATGILQPEFDAPALAREIAGLADYRGRLEAMGRTARERVAALCNGRDRAADLLNLWRGQRRG